MNNPMDDIRNVFGNDDSGPWPAVPELIPEREIESNVKKVLDEEAKRSQDMGVELFDPEMFVAANKAANELQSPEFEASRDFKDVANWFHEQHPRFWGIAWWPTWMRRLWRVNSAFVPVNAISAAIPMLIGGILISKQGIDPTYYALSPNDMKMIVSALIHDLALSDPKSGYTKLHTKPGRTHLEIELSIWLMHVQNTAERLKAQAAMIAAGQRKYEEIMRERQAKAENQDGDQQPLEYGHVGDLSGEKLVVAAPPDLVIADKDGNIHHQPRPEHPGYIELQVPPEISIKDLRKMNTQPPNPQ